MNKQEFKAIQMIAGKMNWQQKPVCDVLEMIKQMVRNQQALNLGCYGECGGEEETLLTIALWDKDEITSTMYVNDYTTMCEWNWNCLCEDFGMLTEDMNSMLEFYMLSENYLAECYEAEDEQMHDDYRYHDMVLREMKYYNHARQMGWE